MTEDLTKDSPSKGAYESVMDGLARKGAGENVIGSDIVQKATGGPYPKPLSEKIADGISQAISGFTSGKKPNLSPK